MVPTLLLAVMMVAPQSHETNFLQTCEVALHAERQLFSRVRQERTPNRALNLRLQSVQSELQLSWERSKNRAPASWRLRLLLDAMVSGNCNHDSRI